MHYILQSIWVRIVLTEILGKMPLRKTPGKFIEGAGVPLKNIHHFKIQCQRLAPNITHFT